MIRLEKLTEEKLVEARKGYKNLLVAVGFIGGMRVLLNPKSVEEILCVAHDYYDDCQVKLLGFDDVFEAYDICPVV